jgi:monovalent cation:H+ antiporter, CPA1 family
LRTEHPSALGNSRSGKRDSARRGDMFDTALVLLVLAGLLVVVGVSQPFAVWLKLPQSVILAALGIAIGALPTITAQFGGPGPIDAAADLFAKLPLNSGIFIYVFLPLLIFEAGVATDVKRAIEDAAPILILAVVATLITAAAIGLAIWPFAQVPLVVCLLLGSIVATTDPAAVIAVFRDIGAPRRLTWLVEGEALLNDAAAIALFILLLGFIEVGRQPTAIAGLGQFTLLFLGGGLFGYIAGRILLWVMRHVSGDRSAEATLTLAFAYLSFVAAERLLHVSGVVAVLTAGLTLSALRTSRITPENWSFLTELWEQIAFWARSLIFVLAAILVPRLLSEVGLRDALLLTVLIAAAFGARAFALFVLVPPLERLGLTQRIDHNYKLALIWGGLRGALTLVLALAVTEHAALPSESQRFVAVLATGFVLFTLFVNGTTLRSVIRLLRLDQLSARDEALRDHILTLSYAEARDAAREIGLSHTLSQEAVDRVTKPYEIKLESTRGRQEAAASYLSESDQLAIALISLANQERALIIGMLRESAVSPSAAQVILGNIEALAEATRSDGPVGYESTSEAILGYPIGFRIALFLYRRLRIVRAIAERLAERLEILLVTRIVLERLITFDKEQIGKLFGERIAGTTQEIVRKRQQAVEAALEQLRQQYPDYLTELEVRFLAQSTLHHEMSRYQSLLEEGLISPELWNDLKRTTFAASSSPLRRPHFDIGLNPQELVKRLDLLASLDERQLEIVCGLLRPRFAVPHERIIRKGDPGDGVYFIASGAVEVILPDRNIQIGAGAFFGEMALLSGRLRQADVDAATYCQLLVLRRLDFEQFIRENPDARAAIMKVAKARQLSNAANGVALR